MIVKIGKVVDNCKTLICYVESAMYRSKLHLKLLNTLILKP